MDYKRLHQLSEELYNYWKKIHGLYLDAAAGFSLVHQSIINKHSSLYKMLGEEAFVEETYLDLDNLTFSYKEIFSTEYCGSGIHDAKDGEVKERNVPGGSNFSTLGQMCIVNIYDYWNEYLRKEYAIAKGLIATKESDQNKITQILSESVIDDFWGDMRLLRNSIVHHRGIALPEIKKCKLIKWFKEGDYINLSPEMMRKIFLAVLTWRNIIHKDSLPKRTFKLPYARKYKKET